MNVGAVTSLSGFMMSDVMYLRTLSIFGSVCGMTYNLTRAPRQWNGAAWGLLFVSTNLVMIYRLQQQRQQTFTVNEMDMFKIDFEPHGVSPETFSRLLQISTWKNLESGEIVVPAGKPLNNVVYLHKGYAEAHGGTHGDPQDSVQGDLLYTFQGASEDCSRTKGCIIGGTALFDDTVTKGNYPLNVKASASSEAVVWNTKALLQLMSEEKALLFAITRMLYVDLIEGQCLRLALDTPLLVVDMMSCKR